MNTSQFNPCMFVDDRVIAVCFVDDILFWSVDDKYIMALGAEFREQGLLPEEEDNAAGFIGVTMCRNDNGSLELKQTGLIDRTFEALGLYTRHTTNKWTPAEATPLAKNEDGEGPQGSFRYSSIVGMLLYL